MELAKSMGVSQIANKEMAETQVYLKNQIGMSADEASSFQKMSMAGGKSAEQNLAVIQAGVEGMTGGLMNYKDVAKDIATSSKGVQAAYKGNIAALTKAVVTAKKFGMTLDQTKKSADSILACFIIVFILSEEIIKLVIVVSTCFANVSPVVFVQYNVKSAKFFVIPFANFLVSQYPNIIFILVPIQVIKTLSVI
jgi:hypothetical protein